MSAQEGVAFRCQRCGAPLEVTPETIVAVCNYCGFPNWTSQAYVYPIELVPGRSREARRLFQKWLESDPDLRGLKGVRIKSVDLVYVPLYVSDVNAASRFWGVAEVTVTKTRVVKRGKETTVETQTRIITVQVEGSLTRDYRIPIVARRSYERETVDPLVTYYMKTLPPGKPIQEVDWESVKGQVLASEIPPGDAERYARDEACDKLSEEVDKKMDEMARQRAMAMAPGWIPSLVTWVDKKKPCKSRVSRLSPIELVPMIIGTYAFRGSMYKAILAGWDGRKVYSEEPLTVTERLVYYSGSVLSSGLLGGAGAAAIVLDHVAAGLVLLGVGVAGAYLLAKKAVSDVRIEGLEG